MDNTHPTKQHTKELSTDISPTQMIDFEKIKQCYQNYNMLTQNQGIDIYLFDNSLEKTTYLFKKGKCYPFLKAVITSIAFFTIAQYHDDILAYVIRFETQVKKNIGIFFLENDLKTPKIFFNKLEKAGLYVTMSLPRTDKLELLRQLIYSKTNRNNPIYFPYKAGWYEKQYWYTTISDAELLSESGIVTPFFQRYFSASDISFDNIEKQIANVLKEPDVLFLFAITAGALAYTPLKNAGYRPNSLFMMDLNLPTTLLSIKLMQHWTKKFHINLSEQKKFTKSLAEFKDEVVILMDNNTNYTLQMSESINLILQNGHLINDEVEELNAIPVLVTTRVKKWHDRCTKTLMLPSPAHNISDECIQSFWKCFCDMFSYEYDDFINEIDKKYDNYLPIHDNINVYSTELQWIIKAYQIFYHYLERKGIPTKYRVMTIEDFDEYISTWLINIEYEDYKKPSEIFIEQLKNMKKNGSIKFVKPCNYSIRENESELIIAVDETYCYIHPTVMEYCVKKALLENNAREVYSALVEDEYAKGENDSHIYPKVPQKAGFKKRIRMAQIKREILLSDADLTLEVI